jgi:hypothetical protein
MNSVLTTQKIQYGALIMTRLSSAVFIVLFFPLNANAAFFVTTDTSTELSGSFDASELSQTYNPVGFDGLLPGNEQSQRIQTIVLNDITDLGRAFFSTPLDGTPDDPDIRCDADVSCSSIFGSYDNNVLGQTVYFEITNLAFDGTTFTGDFSFNVQAVPVPAAVWLFASGLIGLIGLARRKA